MQHADSSLQPLAYGEKPPRLPLWRAARRALAVFAIPIAFWFVTIGYVDRQWRALAPGMTPAQVNQKLWAFASYPNPKYQGLSPGQYVIRYELFHMGKATMIQIVFNTDGTVADAQPIYDI